MSPVVHLLVVLFGMGSWVAINGLWVELPLLVPQVPEGWYLPSYLTIVIQLANVGPLLVAVKHKLSPGRRGERGIIYGVVCVGVLASFLLPFFWKRTSLVAGTRRSVALLVLAFFLALVDCTSSVTFLPFMARLRPHFLTTYFVGEGLSGLAPGLVALAQGAGVVSCREGVGGNGSRNGTVASYRPANFPPEVFFFFLSGVMALCLLAFVLLDRLSPTWRKEPRARPGAGEGKEEPEQKAMVDPGPPRHPSPLALFLALAWVNALTNAVLPAIQTYSCLPYGAPAYHLSAALGALANPLACFVAMVYPNRSLRLMGCLTLAGTAVGAYIMGMAALSPCPWLVHSTAGTPLIVLSWVLFVGTLSYVKVMIGLIMRDEGRSALVWCGAVVQLGSMLGALAMFPLVSVYNLFRSGDPCNTECPV
ncbi:riboflavin transporter 2-like [Amblyraja radiata]|uniref:riboflavin transporter 2-like n=1 Tax=Amblyraja radiata TaxID=386614 RepID=UPI001403C16F|nr:riboflavin transporter 2-like [Amblyraja radiata]